MRLIRIVAAAAFGLVFFAVSAHAATNFASTASTESKTEKTVEKPAAKAAPTAKPDVSKDAKKKRVEEKKKELNGSRWDITLTPSDGKGQPEPEVLTFQNGQVSFKSFSEDGFGTSNYTISIPEGSEIAVWETMHNSKDGVLFVRGEWKDEQMNGIISRQTPDDPEKPARDFTFTTQKRMAIEPTSSSQSEDKSAPALAAGVLSTGPETPSKEEL